MCVSVKRYQICKSTTVSNEPNNQTSNKPNLFTGHFKRTVENHLTTLKIGQQNKIISLSAILRMKSKTSHDADKYYFCFYDSGNNNSNSDYETSTEKNDLVFSKQIMRKHENQGMEGGY